MFQVRDNALGYIKYAGISRAVVMDNNDPLKRGRIRVNSPVLGETGWIPYLTAPGMFSVPEPEDVVYIQCDGGFYTHPVAWGNLNKGADDDLQFPEEFQRASPTNRGMYTPGGHLLELDDGSDLIGTDKGFRFTGSDGTIFHIKEEPLDNSVTIEMPNGTILTIDGTNDAIMAEVAFGDSWELSAANGFQTSTPAAGGTTLSQKGGKIDLTCALDGTFTSEQASLTFEANLDVTVISDTTSITLSASAGDVEAVASGDAKLKLSAGKVGLGGPAGELLEEVSKLADELSKLALEDSTHVHPTAVGPSGPPTNAANMVAVNAAATAIKAIIDLIKGGI